MFRLILGLLLGFGLGLVLRFGLVVGFVFRLLL